MADTWFCTMLEQALACKDFGSGALRRTMHRNTAKLRSPELPTISFDASPWGGGGILWKNGKAVSYTHFVWSDVSFDIIKAKRGDCKGQTSFEFFTLFVVAVTYNEVLGHGSAHSW